MNKIEIQQGNTYIFKKNYVGNVIKGKVLEVTKTTYYIEWETGGKMRYLKEDFDYRAIEDLGNDLIE